jgi:tyramine---L-glutamate ligase
MNVPPSLRREGWAMLSALVEDFQKLPDIEIFTLIDDQWPFALGDVCTRIPWQEEAERFREIAAKCDWTMVIAPEFDDLLLDRSRIVLEVGGRLLGSSPEAVRATGDKWTTATLWQARGVPHPPTRLLESAEFLRSDLPQVLKPRFGAGSQATFLIPAQEEWPGLWQAAQLEWPKGEWIVQQYVPGAAASVALLMGPDGVLPLLPARQHLSSDGRFRYEGGSMPLPEPFAERAVRLARQAVADMAGLQGYVGVDLVLGKSDDGSDDYAIEINPRLTTSYIGLRQLCRQNLAELILRCAQGETLTPPTWLAGEVRYSV